MNQSLKGGRREGIKSMVWRLTLGFALEKQGDFLFCDREKEEWVGINTPFVEEGWATGGVMPKASVFTARKRQCYATESNETEPKPWS